MNRRSFLSLFAAIGIVKVPTVEARMFHLGDRHTVTESVPTSPAYWCQTYYNQHTDDMRMRVHTMWEGEEYGLEGDCHYDKVTAGYLDWQTALKETHDVLLYFMNINARLAGRPELTMRVFGREANGFKHPEIWFEGARAL